MQKKSERITGRVLRVETLESRELLSLSAPEFAAVAAMPASETAHADVADDGIIELSDAVPDSASVILVDSLDDVVDASDGKTTLREAISKANAGDTITFDPSLAGGTITLVNGQLEISQAITIDASALCNAAEGVPGITIDGNNASRVFYVTGGTQTDPVVVNGLAVANGCRPDAGGGIAVGNRGCMAASNVTVIGNSAGESGGGIYIAADSSLDMINSVVAGNSAEKYGAGIYNAGSLRVVNAAVSGNTAQICGGGIYNADGAASVFNTIAARNAAPESPDIYSTNTVVGSNNISSNTKWAGSVNYTYDKNQPLFMNYEAGDYRLAFGSQAIGKGADAYAYAAGMDEGSTDLAGGRRFNGDSVDIGPYEYYAEGLFVRTYNRLSHQVIMEWDPIPGAVTYIFKVLKENARWVAYGGKSVNAYKVVNGIYPGTSYEFRVYGVDANGKILDDYRERLIEPIGLVAADKPYTANSAKTTTLQAASVNTVRINWYRITDDGLVEIPGTLNKTSYVPNDARYELKVVATGSVETSGFSAEINIARPNKTITFTDQNASGTSATASWEDLPGAAGYVLKVSRDGGETWITKKKDLTTNSVRLLNIADGNIFRVTAVDAEGKALKSIALGSFQAAPPQDAPNIVFTNVNSAMTAATLTWRPIDGAFSYKIRLSRDGGASWIDKAKDITSNTKSLVAIEAGYLFRIYGYDANGRRIAPYYEAVFRDDSLALRLDAADVDDAFADFFAEEEELVCRS